MTERQYLHNAGNLLIRPTSICVISISAALAQVIVLPRLQQTQHCEGVMDVFADGLCGTDNTQTPLRSRREGEFWV